MENSGRYSEFTGMNQTKIQRMDMSPQEIIDFLNDGAVYRTFKDVLSKVYSENDLYKTLVDRLTEMTNGKRDSVARNVSNWMSGKSEPQRESLFQICFALNMDEQQANQLLASSSDTGIHYRNPTELIYSFCLRTGKSYGDARELKEKLLPVYEAAASSEKQPEKDSVTWRNPAMYTSYIKNEFNRTVTSENELCCFFQECGSIMGTLHNTAYKEFIHMLHHLQNPDAEFSREMQSYVKLNKNFLDEASLRELEKRKKGMKRQAIKSLVEEILQMNVPAGSRKRKSGGVSGPNESYLQRVIKENWPSEDILNKMKSRETDVSRKVLLLLFLLTEEFEVAEVDVSATQPGFEELYFEQIESEDGGERMEARLILINLFLDRYGMNRLDPGNAFDCIVLYALRASYCGGKGEPMGRRLKQTLELLFPEPHENVKIQ